jgi:tetratricopeptide (TPR) repeat protein
MSALGKMVNTFARTPALNVMTLLLFIIPLALLAPGVIAAVQGSLFGSPLGTGLRVLFVLGGGGGTLFLGGHLLLTLWNLNVRVAVHEHGFIHRVRWHAWQVRWDEVEAIHRLSETRLRWSARDGRSAVIGPLPPALASEALGTFQRALSMLSSPEDAAGLLQFAAQCVSSGDLDRASDALRRAAALPAHDDVSQKLRITILMNLGEVLAHAHRLDEAEHVLRENFAEREIFYGREHAGYAYGAEALADLLFTRGQHEEALQHAQDAARLFARLAHERLPAALALRALLVKACDGAEAPGFDLTALSDAQIEATVHALFVRAQRAPSDIAFAVLDELVTALETRPLLRRARLNAVAFTANLARQHADHQRGIRAAQQAIALLDQPEDALEKTRSLEGLALFYSHARRNHEAEASYEDALQRARELGDRAVQSRIHRNLGLHLSQLGEQPRAAEHLACAVQLARHDGPAELLGEALTAYGIFLQHQDDSAQARPLLEEALQLLPPATSTTLTARAHLRSVEAGKTCDCAANIPAAIAEGVLAMIAGKVPSDLIGELVIERAAEGQPNVRVALTRAPTHEEQLALDQAIRAAMHQLQNNVRNEHLAR